MSDLRQQLTRAAEQFPVRGWPEDLKRRATRRRRLAASCALSIAAAAVVAVVVVVPRVSTPSAGPASGAADYVGSEWRLTIVQQGAKSTAIPASIRAQMNLLQDGRVQISDGLNGISGQLARNAHGFEVRNAATTLMGYPGSDPGKLAAIRGFRAAAMQGRQDFVLTVSSTQLVINAGAYRLTFVRVGPAVAWP